MEADVIQNLILKFKSGTKKEQNKLFIEIESHYKPIISRIIKEHHHTEDAYQELLSIARIQLFTAINNYNITSKAQFNTYCYYYLVATPRLYWQQQKMKETNEHKQNDEQYLEYYDLMLDIEKILTKEEQQVFKVYTSQKLSDSKITRRIETKIREYIKWN